MTHVSSYDGITDNEVHVGCCIDVPSDVVVLTATMTDDLGRHQVGRPRHCATCDSRRSSPPEFIRLCHQPATTTTAKQTNKKGILCPNSCRGENDNSADGGKRQGVTSKDHFCVIGHRCHEQLMTRVRTTRDEYTVGRHRPDSLAEPLWKNDCAHCQTIRHQCRGLHSSGATVPWFHSGVASTGLCIGATSQLQALLMCFSRCRILCKAQKTCTCVGKNKKETCMSCQRTMFFAFGCWCFQRNRQLFVRGGGLGSLGCIPVPIF